MDFETGRRELDEVAEAEEGEFGVLKLGDDSLTSDSPVHSQATRADYHRRQNLGGYHVTGISEESVGAHRLACPRGRGPANTAINFTLHLARRHCEVL